MVEICAVGGYNEIGKNMTAIKIGDDVVILDMGLHLEKIIGYDEQEQESMGTEDMLSIGAIPDDSVISAWKDDVRAIIIGHGHLDHCGAAPYLANKYDCDVIGTPYSVEILKSILKDRNIRIKNKLKMLNCNSSIKICNDVKVEFINMTHSILQTVMVAIDTSEGVILYANDFKFDNHPVIGKKPNYNKLRNLGNVLALIVDSTRADEAQKTPSEKVARELLRDVLLGTDNYNKLIVVTTFSSHIARLSSILEFGRKLNRKVVFLGRSLNKYVRLAEKLNLVKFSSKAEIVGFKSKIRRKLKVIGRDRGNYLVVCTGNQGEPDAVLCKMANNEFPFRFLDGDHVVFSCRTIPSEVNKANRAVLEEKLKQQKVRIFKDIHSSGHASREDLRDLINMVKPKHVIPAHGNINKLSALADLTCELGYILGEDVHVMRNGQRLKII